MTELQRRLRWVFALHLVQALFLLWVAAGSKFCCDAFYYQITGDNLLRDGVSYQDDYAGYRSYFVPLLIALLRSVPIPPWTVSGSNYPLVASAFFVLICFSASMHIVRRESLGRYLSLAVPTIFNPFVLAYVPFPLQEGAFVLLCVPLLLVLIAVRERAAHWSLALAVLCGTLAYIIRASYLWFYAPLALLMVHHVWHRSAAWRRPLEIKLLAAAVLSSVPLMLPQSYIMWHKFGTWRLYPNSEVLDQQISWGIRSFKYATLLMDGTALGGVGILYPSPQAYWSADRLDLSFYARDPGSGLLQIGTHIWAGLHYDVLTTFVSREELQNASGWLIGSALIVAYGLLGLWRGVRTRAEPALNLTLLCMFALSCAYTALIATEARFGLIGFIALSISAAQLAADRAGRREMLRVAPLVLAYTGLCVLINGLLLQSARLFRDGALVPLFGAN